MPDVIPLGPAARMLTTREAALRLGVSLRTVQLWVEADILPAARTPGGHRRIPYNAVEALALSTGLGGDPIADKARGDEPLSKPAARPPRRKALSHDARPQDVLLVTGDEQWRSECARALEIFGPALELRFAETGYLALLQMGRKAPDLLITGLELPGMDGFEMLWALERWDCMLDVLPVLALTSLNAQQIDARGGLPEDVEVLTEPVSPEALAMQVGRWLLRQRTMSEEDWVS